MLAVVSTFGMTSGWPNDCGAGCTPPPLPEIVRVPRMAWNAQWKLYVPGAKLLMLAIVVGGSPGLAI